MTARVLVVDDSFASVALLNAHLKSEYFETISANDGSEALTAVLENPPDLVVLDLVMDGMDGFEVCRQIKSNPATTHIPILVLSGLDEPADRARALNAGADAYMTKPPKPLPFIARVRSLIQSKRVTDEVRFPERSGPKIRLESEPSATMLNVDVSGGQLLFITDDRLTLDQIRIPLAPHHQVHMDGDPEDALLVVKRAEFDVILVDLALRSTEGLRFCSRLRTLEETRRTPLLAVMCEDDAVVRLRALEMGVSDFVTLPVHPGELEAIVNAQVRNKRYHNALRQSLQSSLDSAVMDPLTGIHNRGYLNSHLGPLVSQNVARGRPVSLAILDVDHFKQVNDTYGHDVGDEVLRAVARRISSNMRGIELCCRFGGEEFVAAFSGADSATAVSIGERLRRNVCEAPVAIRTRKSSVRVTISIGVATSSGIADTAEMILKRADLALYRAKNEGRNRVVAAGANDSPGPESAIEKRGNPRDARRIPCEVWIQGTRRLGIVKDVSRGGVFVQTHATASPGTAVTIVIAASQGRTEIRIPGCVARSDLIQAHLAMQSVGGLGIEVIQPGALGRLLDDLRLVESETETRDA